MNSTSIENRKQLAELLNRPDGVSENAFLCAIHNKTYAHNLLMCKESGDLLDHLLAHPPLESIRDIRHNELTNLELARKATKAMVSWAKTGFSSADFEMLERRENACLSCEYLGKPQKVLQKLVTSKSKEHVGHRASDCVCNLCGCSISKKIRLPSESCPGRHPDNDSLNRWGEPVAKAG